MGMLIDGEWHDVWYDTKETKGHFKRSESQFRSWVTVDGSPGPSGDGGPENGADPSSGGTCPRCGASL